MKVLTTEEREGLAKVFDMMAERIRDAVRNPVSVITNQSHPIEVTSGGPQRTGHFGFDCSVRIEYEPEMLRTSKDEA